MPIRDGGGDRKNKRRGDFMITLTIEFPKVLSDQQKASLKTLLK